MFALKEHIKAAGLSLAQAEAASASGVTQPRISDLVRGKINVFFGLDALVNMAVAAGLRVETKVIAARS